MANTITITGNLVKEPEFNYSPKGTAIVNFTLADNGFQNGEKSVIYWDCFAFGEQAERLGNNFIKGREYTIKGEVVPNNYEKDGVKHYRQRINAQSIKNGRKPKSATQQEAV